MWENEGVGVERLTGHIGMWVSVHIVADDGVTDVGKMYAKLMRTPGDGLCLHQRIAVRDGQRAITRQSIVAALLRRADTADDDASAGSGAPSRTAR